MNVDTLPAEVRENLGVSIAPLLEQHEQHGVERTVLGRQRIVNELDNVLQALRCDPDEETARSTDVVGRRFDQVVSQSSVITVSRQL